MTATVSSAAAGRRVWVNVEGVDAAHPLTVELLDDHDRPIPGFSGAEAAEVTAAGTRVAVAWPAGEGDGGPPQQPFVVRLSFPESGDARLYAVYVGQ